MMPVALFDALKDFSPLGQQARPARVVEPIMAERKAPDIETIVAGRVAAAEAALRAELASEHAAALEALRQEHAAALDELHLRFGEELGVELGRKIAEAEGRIVDFSVAALARTVGSLLSEDIQKRSVAALAAAIGGAIADRDAVRIRVRGPLSLFEALQGALGARAAGLDFVDAPGFDLSVSIDGNPIETRLAAWSVGLSEILA